MNLVMRVEIKNNTMFINALTGLFPQSLLSEVNGFTIDSRLIQNGDVYLPIKGENIDGHDFIPQAIANGASLIFSEQSSTEALTEVIYVESTVDTLKELSIGYMSQIQCPIISITGSNGKTTTKELLSHILGSYKKIMCTAGNYNSTIGLPISIFSIAGDATVLSFFLLERVLCWLFLPFLSARSVLVRLISSAPLLPLRCKLSLLILWCVRRDVLLLDPSKEFASKSSIFMLPLLSQLSLDPASI